jgi:hypothetical protein
MDEAQSDAGQKLDPGHERDSGQSDGGQVSDGDQERTPEQVRREIEQTRIELGDTVAALAEKADVKEQAKQAASEVKESVSGKASELRQTVLERKDDLVSSAREATPDSAIDARQKLGGLLISNPVPVAALGAFVLGVLVGRRST